MHPIFERGASGLTFFKPGGGSDSHPWGQPHHLTGAAHTPERGGAREPTFHTSKLQTGGGFEFHPGGATQTLREGDLGGPNSSNPGGSSLQPAGGSPIFKQGSPDTKKGGLGGYTLHTGGGLKFHPRGGGQTDPERGGLGARSLHCRVQPVSSPEREQPYPQTGQPFTLHTGGGTQPHLHPGGSSTDTTSMEVPASSPPMPHHHTGGGTQPHRHNEGGPSHVSTHGGALPQHHTGRRHPALSPHRGQAPTPS